MAGKISFQFLLEGTESAAAKLKAIESLSANLSKGISAGDLMKATQGNFSASTIAKNKELFAMLGKDAGKSFDNGLKSSNSALGAFLNQSMGIGAGQNRPNRANYAHFWQNAIPPVIAPPVLAGSSGGGGGIGGGITALLGGLGPVGKIAAVAVSLGILREVVNALKFAMNELLDAVKRGSKLFIDSAKLGKNPAKLSQLRYALGAVGISESEADLLMLNTEFGRRGSRGNSRTQTSAAGSVLTGMRTIQSGNIQQLLNLSKQFDKAWDDAAISAKISGDNAKVIFQLSNVSFMALKREWNTLWEELAADLGAFLIPVIDHIKDQLKILNIIISNSQLGYLKRILDFIYPNAGTSQLGNSSNSRIPRNAMERMGFVFNSGNFGMGDHQKDIAKNTKDTAIGIKALSRSLGEKMAGLALDAGVFATNP